MKEREEAKEGGKTRGEKKTREGEKKKPVRGSVRYPADQEEVL